MRTIKFKAKRLDNGEWDSGDLSHSLVGKLDILGFVEEEDDRKGCLVPVCVKTERVDGIKIKPDTWYKLQNGEFVEI